MLLLKITAIALIFTICDAWQCNTYYTGWNDEGNGGVHFLDRHWVHCDQQRTKHGRGILQEVKLERRNHRKSFF